MFRFRLWCALLLAGTSAPAQTNIITSASLPQEAYVWQRTWNEPVREAVTRHAGSFASLVALAAEVSWKQGRPQVTRVPLDDAALREAGCPVGLALRVGPYPGSFAAEGEPVNSLSTLAATLLAEAATNGVKVRELQLDFDCAESKLEGYQVWVQAIRRTIRPVPLVITTLPAWLNQKSFQQLVSAADGYILQVHSLERPKGPDAAFAICSPDAARRAVERAGQLGLPFRVALPTYGYRAAFGPDGKLLGLSAEGPGRKWPAGTRFREARSDPAAIAGLVQGWTTNRPAALKGIIWYRLPILLDELNWSWPTLNSVMAGRAPRASLRVEAVRPKAGLKEINLVNDGEADLSSRPVIEVRWRDARLVASDGLRDFEVVDPGPDTLKFHVRTNVIPSRLPPGARQSVGWMRFDREVEVQLEIKTP